MATGPVFRVWSDRRRGSHGHRGGPGGAALIRGQLGRLGQPDHITKTTFEDFQDFTREREDKGGQRQGECRGFPFPGGCSYHSVLGLIASVRHLTQHCPTETGPTEPGPTGGLFRASVVTGSLLLPQAWSAAFPLTRLLSQARPSLSHHVNFTSSCEK